MWSDELRIMLDMGATTTEYSYDLQRWGSVTRGDTTTHGAVWSTSNWIASKNGTAFALGMAPFGNFTALASPASSTDPLQLQQVFSMQDGRDLCIFCTDASNPAEEGFYRLVSPSDSWLADAIAPSEILPLQFLHTHGFLAASSNDMSAYEVLPGIIMTTEGALLNTLTKPFRAVDSITTSIPNHQTLQRTIASGNGYIAWVDSTTSIGYVRTQQVGGSPTRTEVTLSGSSNIVAVLHNGAEFVVVDDTADMLYVGDDPENLIPISCQSFGSAPLAIHPVDLSRPANRGGITWP